MQYLVILIIIAIVLIELPKIIAFVAPFFTGIVFPILGAIAAIIGLIILIKIIKWVIAKLNDGSVRPKKSVSASKVECQWSDFSNLESQILTNEYNDDFVDYFNLCQPFDVQIEFIKEKLTHTKFDGNRTVREDELEIITNNKQEAIRDSGLVPYQYYIPSIHLPDSELNSFTSVISLVSGIDTASNHRTAKEYETILHHFFHEGTSIIICGVIGCAVLLPEYVIVKEYGNAPFKCIPYDSRMFYVSYKDKVLYNSYEHGYRKDHHHTVWKYQNKDGSRDQRYNDNPSTEYIDLADLSFCLDCGFEIITREIGFEYYDDGAEFTRKWNYFIKKNEEFLRKNDDLLGAPPMKEDSVKETDQIIIPESSPYYRKTRRSHTISQIDSFDSSSSDK